MRVRAAELRAETGPMLSLAVPVALGELAWMGMGVVDTMMVGRVSPEALGAMSIGRIAFMTVGVFGIGLLLGLDTLVSRSFGAGDREDCRYSLVQGVYLAVLLTVPLAVVFAVTRPLLERLGIHPAVLEPAVDYMQVVGWAMLPLLLFTAFRRYLQAVNHVRPVMLALVSANLLNAACNWVLIFGKLGAPALGATGAAWATVIAMSYMAAFLWLTIRLVDRDERARHPRGIPLPGAERMRQLLALGLPAAIQITLEVGVFATATMLAGRLASAGLAAHQVVLTLASVTYMVPLGISSAGAVRVGQALGRERPREAATAGWTAILLGAVFMVLAAIVFVVAPGPLIRIFTADARVLAVGAPLLLVAAVFQIFDGVFASSVGALRGLGDTRTPMLAALIGYWVIALPLGYGLCFAGGLDVLGLWIGLSTGLILVALSILLVWTYRARALVLGTTLPTSHS